MVLLDIIFVNHSYKFLKFGVVQSRFWILHFSVIQNKITLKIFVYIDSFEKNSIKFYE